MSNIRESFPILEDGSNVGQVINQVIPGTTAASANVSTLAAPAFQDAAGILVYPQLDANGAIVVVGENVNPVYVAASAAGSITEVLVATCVLVASKNVQGIQAMVSCRRGSLFRLAWNNNGSESNLGFAILDSGMYSYNMELDFIKLAVGTGTQQLKMYALNFDKASDFFAEISANQVA